MDTALSMNTLFILLALLATILKTGDSRTVVEQLLGLEETADLNKCVLN
jgi:hypothetical protein